MKSPSERCRAALRARREITRFHRVVDRNGVVICLSLGSPACWPALAAPLIVVPIVLPLVARAAQGLLDALGRAKR